MKREFERPSAALIAVYRGLAVALAVAAAVIVAGTAYSIWSKRPAATAGKNPTGENVEAIAGTAYFTGIGRIRVALPGDDTSVLVVSIIFPYDRGDLAFSEELAATTRKFRETAIAYFSSIPASELKSMPEEALKNELKQRFNALLQLGNIDALYFGDYFLID
jgi:flagellar basal body-associated protein FliL